MARGAWAKGDGPENFGAQNGSNDRHGSSDGGEAEGTIDEESRRRGEPRVEGDPAEIEGEGKVKENPEGDY